MADLPAQIPQSVKPHRIFLTGAAGRLARFLLPLLYQAGHQIVAVDRRNCQCAPENPKSPPIQQLNLLDGPAARVAMEAQLPDTLIHLANHAWPRACPPAQLFNENITMTMNVFDAARALAVRRIIFASTVQVMASEWLEGYSLRPPRPAYLPLNGHAPPDPINTYAASKLVGETILAQWSTELDLQAVSLRFPMLIDFDLPYVKKWRAGKLPEPTPTVIAQGFSWLSYRDAARLVATLMTAQWNGHRIYYPASPSPRSSRSVPVLLEKHYRNTPRKPGHNGSMQSLIDISAITRETGWSPQDVLFGNAPDAPAEPPA